MLRRPGRRWPSRVSLFRGSRSGLRPGCSRGEVPDRVAAASRKTFLALDKPVRRRIGEAVDALAVGPRPASAKMITGAHGVLRILLGRQGVVVAERTLHRFAAERCGAAGSKVSTRVDDGPPGSELQIDFGDLGLIPAGIPDGRRRKLSALVFTASFSRYMFAYLTFSMTLEEVIDGCEEAWQFFGGIFRVVIPDNMSPVVARADAVNPHLGEMRFSCP
jgi:hypothetical protein